ncbi:MAG: PVC-type heme-binding CxxCH protein [Planctomycetota bacterium]
MRFTLICTRRLVVLLGVLVILLSAHATSHADPPKRVLMLAGNPSHGYGAHEHYAGLRILADALNQASSSVQTEVIRGWPEQASKIDAADAIVIYCDGGKRHMATPHLELLRQHLAKGGGLVALHYGTELVPGDVGDAWLEMMGGHFEIDYSVNPHWKAEFTSLPDHPISNGVAPFATDDEWYFHLRFAQDDHLTPILQAVAPEHTMRRKDGHHSGNPHVRRSVANGEPQTVAWAYESPIGGRSFGFTGGHHHWNWAEPNVRRLVTNAIRWAAGDTIEVGGSQTDPLTEPKMLANQDYDPPKKFDFEEIKARFELPIGYDDGAVKPAEADAANLQPKAKLLTVSPLVTIETSRYRVDMDVPLNDLDDERNLYLVVTDGGDGFQCDWANWAVPTLIGPKGEQSLLDLPWESAQSGFGKVEKNANCRGQTAIIRKDALTPVIGTHAPSVIHYRIPQGYDRLTVTAGLDKGGTDQQDGKVSSVRFAIFSGGKPSDLSSIDRRSGKEQRDPANALAGLKVAQDLEATLMASEPQLRSLTNLDIDHRGRVWVCDVMNYRRRNGARPEGDRILILEDTTRDGQLDSVKTFYQGRDIDSAMGICVLGQDVIVSASPTIWKFTDHDGDDVPDEKVALFTETGQAQHDHSAHSFLFGPDGMLYWNFGNTGNQVKDVNGETVIDIHGRPVVDDGKPLFGGMPFRCDLDGERFEVLAHNFRNNWETPVDSLGTLWQSDNDDDGNRATRINFVMEQGNYGYRDELTGGTWRQDRITMEDEIPQRHWHLNDPGVVPNLLQTGAGSPCGICVYEGRLLPKQFWDQVIHCDPGPNMVRAYPVTPQGAGYSATIEPLLTGITDKWFRPADVCVAPDGSLFVTDWYDPGVGGHRQEDSDRGRLFRIAPPGHTYAVKEPDLSNATSAAAALRSPNRATRYMAWRALESMGTDGHDAVAGLLDDENPRIRARAFWFLGKQPQMERATIDRALSDADPNIRIVGIRLAKQAEGVWASETAGHLANNSEVAVRRELAISLRFDKSSAMPGVWARLAQQHDGRDRWYLEALGIGSDSRPNECFAAWESLVGQDWNTDGGRDIVWRVRAKAAAQSLVAIISDASLPLAETDRHFRALEYHAPQVRDLALSRLLPTKSHSTGREPAAQDEIVVRAVMRMSDFDPSENPGAVAAIERHIGRKVGTPEYLDLVRRFRPSGATAELEKVMLSSSNDSQSVAAMQVLLEGPDGFHRFATYFSELESRQLRRVARLLGAIGNQRTTNLLTRLMQTSDEKFEIRAAAVRALAKSGLGAKQLLSMAEDGSLPAETRLLAGGCLANHADDRIAKRAATLLPLPAAADRTPLAPLDQLASMTGNVGNGLNFFRNKGTCANCHLVSGQGKQVGPDLTEIGDKLSRQAMFTAILDPSAGISHNFENHIALTDSGQVVTGILVTQTDEEVVLRNAEAIDIVIDADELIELKKSPKSIMPENLHHTTDQQGLVDLVEYLMTLTKQS